MISEPKQVASQPVKEKAVNQSEEWWI
jgi:hypothetical protein